MSCHGCLGNLPHRKCDFFMINLCIIFSAVVDSEIEFKFSILRILHKLKTHKI